MHEAGGVARSQDEDDEADVACTSPSCYIMTKEKEREREERKEEKGREKGEEGDDGQIRNRGLRLSRS